jgi:long-subunit fatty acid transport protein
MRKIEMVTRVSCVALGLAALAGVFLAAPVCAQLLGEGEPVEVPLAYDFGVGARAMGMGGAYTAVAEDASALYYNPAGLALIRRIELGAAFTHQNDKLTVNYRGRSLDSPISSTNLHQVALAYPVPTYRGSFVLGFGYHRIVSLDRDYFRSGMTLSGVEEVESISERGGLGLYSVGVAFDASPDVSLGLSFGLLGGSSDVSYSFSQTAAGEEPDEYWYKSESDIDGYTGSMGLLYKFEPIGRLGFAVQFPRKIDLNGVFQDADVLESFKDDITLPFTLCGGVALTPPNFLIAMDLRFTDWSQIDFDGPIRFVDEYGRRRAAYKSTTEFHAGAEIMFPDLPIRLRAGYYYDPVPYRLFFTDNAYQLAKIDQERDYFTLGAGVILEEALTLDVAFVSGGFTRSALQTVEDYEQDRVFMSAAYRF